MFHPLASLFRRSSYRWEEGDVKYYVQDYLQRKLKSEALLCEKVHRGIVVIRVNSPAAQQEVTLLEFDLARDLKKDTTYLLHQLIVYCTP